MSGPDLVSRPQLDLGFARRGERTVLDRRLFSWPFVLARTFTLDVAPRHMLTAIIQTSSSALHGTDRLEQRITVAADAAAHVVTQGATAVHRAHPGTVTHEMVRLRIEPGGLLEYLPGPRILFPDAAMDSTVEIDCAAQGIAVVADAFTVHDPARTGRRFRSLSSTVVLRREGGEALMVDRLRLDGTEPRHFDRHTAYGTLYLIAARPAQALGALAQQLCADLEAESGLYAAVSQLPQGAGVSLRFASAELRGVRAGLDIAWRVLRGELSGAKPGRGLAMPSTER